MHPIDFIYQDYFLKYRSLPDYKSLGCKVVDLSSDEVLRQTIRSTLGRLGSAEEIAHAVSFLASPMAGYITGETLHVNGGMFMA